MLSSFISYFSHFLYSFICTCIFSLILFLSDRVMWNLVQICFVLSLFADQSEPSIRHTFYRVVSGLTPPPPWIIIPVRNQPRVCVLKAILWFNLFLNTSPVLFRSCESLSECLTFLNLTNSGLADLTGIRHLKKPLKHCIFSRTRVGQSNLQYSGDSTQYSGELLQYSTAGSQYLYPH